MTVRSYKTESRDPRLFNLVSGPIPRTEQFVGDRAMPIIPVEDYKGVFKVKSARNFAGAAEKSGFRAFGADRKARISTGMDDVPYNVTRAISGVAEMSIEDYLQSLRNVKFGGEPPDVQMALEAAYDVRYTQEKQTADLFMTAANWATSGACAALDGTIGSSDSGNTAWSSESSTPDIDLVNIKEFVRSMTYGVDPAQMGLRFDHDTMVALQKHVASSDIVRVGDKTKGITMTGGRRIAAQNVVIDWIRAITGIQDIEVYSVRRETANPTQTSSKANVATSGSLWCGVLHGPIRPAGNGGTVKAVACGMPRVGGWHGYEAHLPNREAPVKHEITAELYQEPLIFDNTIACLITGCA